VKRQLIVLGLAVATFMVAAEPPTAQEPVRMTHHAKGIFSVKVTPQPPDDSAGGPFGRLFLDKTFRGDLEGTSKGQMLGTGSPDDGWGGYVALERVTGTLSGRRGTFELQHNGTMRNGVATMIVNVVPGSGTGELAGLEGRFTIIIEGKRHSYEFEYTLGEGARKD
jgi:hypothetical protein